MPPAGVPDAEMADEPEAAPKGPTRVFEVVAKHKLTTINRVEPRHTTRGKPSADTLLQLVAPGLKRCSWQLKRVQHDVVCKEATRQLMVRYTTSLKYFLVGASTAAKCIWIGHASSEDPSLPGDQCHFRNRMQGVNVVKFVEAFRETVDMVYTNVAVHDGGHDVCLVWEDLLTELGKDARNKKCAHIFIISLLHIHRRCM